MVESSGVGVLDKAVGILERLAEGPARLGDLVAATGLSRATAHRLASALSVHGLVSTDAGGRYALGPALRRLAAAGGGEKLPALAPPVLRRLHQRTGESAQIYLRQGEGRVCIAAVDPPHGLRDSVPVGAVLPMTAGSAARVLLAFDPQRPPPPPGAAFSAAALAAARRHGYAATVAEREVGVASVSAPVRDQAGQVAAAVSVSGPVERIGRSPGRRFGAEVLAAAAELEAALRAAGA